MKIRNGFVSNSSSSSFVCVISGEVDAAYEDTSYTDMNMMRCVNGHTFNERYFNYNYLSIEEKKAYMLDRADDDEEILGIDECKTDLEISHLFNESIKWDISRYVDSREELSAEECPVCRFDKPSIEEMYKYLLFKCKSPVEEILKEIKSEYRTWVKFNEQVLKKVELS